MLPINGNNSSMEGVSFILPCYNPLLGWQQTIIDSIQVLSKLIPIKELIIVNDGSKDLIATASIENALSIPLIYVSYPDNKGKGHAIRAGIAHATQPIILYTDIDFPYDNESVMDIYRHLEDHKGSIVVGVKNKAYYQNVPFIRRVLSKGLRRMIALFLNMNITDTQCGLKGFWAEHQTIWLDGKINRYLFDLEALYKADKKGIKIIPVPVNLKPNVQFTQVPMRLLLAELKNFWSILKSKA